MHATIDSIRKDAGYSLVEVSLALLVVAIGLLAVFGLFPEGLNATRAAVDDTEVAAFADYVFSSLDFEAANTNELWDDFETSGSFQLMKSHSMNTNLQPIIVPSGVIEVENPYYWIPNFYAGDVWLDGNIKAAYFTYKFSIAEVNAYPGLKYARLQVWPGQYPSGQTPGTPGKVFYREYLPLR
ncbi:MAG TPA: hypothetical protein DCZ95_12720 [Verrucomicrobia bacterium]|nr:MAG: hypothetical protein A2X46_11945 [Lentisphaerae bacterium GWF2_57_35]HBA84950.1 hypothetical protein [Verrucomicrobiota bacterium]